MKKKNPAAVALGKLAKGKPKRYSKEELVRRTKLLKSFRNRNTESPKVNSTRGDSDNTLGK